MPTNRFIFGLAWRAISIGALAYLITHLLATTQLYATVLVLVGIVALLCLSLAGQLSLADRSFERLIEALATDPVDMPTSLGGSARFLAPLHKAVGSLREQRRQREQQVEYVRALLDTVGAALIVLHPDGRISLINRAARVLGGHSATRLEDVAAVGPAAAELIASFTPGARHIVRFANGQNMYVSCAQFSTPGKPAERLISILRIAGELDAVEVKAWNDMTRVLAHEIMNSLTPIASLSESLERLFQGTAAASEQRPSVGDGEVAAALEVIKRRSLGLISFVDRYRTVADLPNASPRVIALPPFLAGIERLMSGTLNERTVEFSYRVSPSDLEINADPELLEQALINLVRNAADAVADSSEPRIEIRCERQIDNVAISVRDNGCGLPQAEGEVVMVPFFTTKRGGSGIGLSVARHVALVHGGQLDMRRNPEGGSTFTLILPTLTDERAAAASKHASELIQS